MRGRSRCTPLAALQACRVCMKEYSMTHATPEQAQQAQQATDSSAPPVSPGALLLVQAQNQAQNQAQSQAQSQAQNQAQSQAQKQAQSQAWCASAPLATEKPSHLQQGPPRLRTRTMSTGALLMGPVSRCCSRSRAWMRPNSTSAHTQTNNAGGVGRHGTDMGGRRSERKQAGQQGAGPSAVQHRMVRFVLQR